MLPIRCNGRIKSFKIAKHLERISKIKLFIDICNWEGINYPSEKDNWKKNQKNNLTIALNV